MALWKHRELPVEEKSCEYLLQIEKDEHQLRKEVTIPTHVRLLNRLRLVYLHKAFSIRDQIRSLFRHPLDAFSSIALVLILLYLPLAILYSIGWTLWHRNLEITLLSLLLLGAGAAPIIAHLVLGVVDHRYLVEFIPIFTISAIAAGAMLRRNTKTF